MTDLEIKQIIKNTEIDLMAITQNPDYLITKFKKLSQRGKEEVLDCLNKQLYYDSKIDNSKPNFKVPKNKVKDNEFSKFTVTDGIQIYNKCELLDKNQFRVIEEYITELYKLEPKKRGGHPRYYSSKYEKLSLFSKRKVIDRINKLLNPTLESTEKKVLSNIANTENVIQIEFLNKNSEKNGGLYEV